MSSKLKRTGHDRLAGISEAVQNWLKPDNRRLKKAVDRTIDEGLFSQEDTRHQIRSLKQSLTPEAIGRWVGRTRVSPGWMAGTRTLAFHAGNLPLAGLQDILAIAISGTTYRGKVSSKDPYLIESLASELVDQDVLEDPVLSTELNGLDEAEADFCLFSGASDSLGELEERVRRLSLLNSESEWLIRTAHFSIAYLDSQEPELLHRLSEAILRYGGKGCRSVGMVVSSFPFDPVRCGLTDYFEAYWIKNPPHERPPQALRQRYAYNEAIERKQLWLRDLLIENSEDEPEYPSLVSWTVGDETDLATLGRKYSRQLQSIYLPDSMETPSSLPTDLAGRCEPISQAQSPPIDWRPDGVDTLEWLSQRQ